MKLQTKTTNNPGKNEKPTTGFDITRCAKGTYLLKIWGRFSPGWLGCLSAGLSLHRISILEGCAKKNLLLWEAMFEIATTPGASDPTRLDVLALAATDADSSTATTFSLDGFTLDPPEKNGGALILEVRARDQLGFLGAILNLLAFLFLFPEEMEIDTTGGKIRDRFRIRGVGGNPPSANAVEALRRKLEECISH